MNEERKTVEDSQRLARESDSVQDIANVLAEINWEQNQVVYEIKQIEKQIQETLSEETLPDDFQEAINKAENLRY